MRSDFTPKGIAFILVTVFTPFFLFYSFAGLLINKENVERNAIFSKFNLPILHSVQLRMLILSIFKKEKKETPKLFHNAISGLIVRRKITMPLLIVFGLFLTSFFYYTFFGDYIGQTQYLYSDDGRILSDTKAKVHKSNFARLKESNRLE